MIADEMITKGKMLCFFFVKFFKKMYEDQSGELVCGCYG